MQKKFLLALLFGALVALSSLPAIRADSDSHNDSGCSSGSKGSSSGDCGGDSTEREDAGSWEKSYEKDKDTCHELTDGAEENDGDCELIQGLTQISLTLTVEYQAIFNQFIAQLKTQLSVTVDISIVSSLFLDFQAEYPDVWAVVQYKNISDWGVVARYSKVVGFELSQSISTVAVLDEEDNCALFEAFLNFSETQGLKDAAQGFIDEELRPFLLNITLVGKKKVIAIAQLIQAFIARNPSYAAFLNAKIPGWGILKKYIYVANQFEQLRWVKSVLRGGASDNVLVVALQAKFEELAAAGELTIAVQFQNIIQQLEIEFASEVSFRGRLAIFIKILRAQGRLNWDFLQYCYDVYLPNFGSIFDLIHCGPYLLTESLIAASTPTTVCSCTCATPSV